MIYEIHLYIPKTGRLTPAMVEWLFRYSLSEQLESHWPVYRIRPRALARRLKELDPTLVEVDAPADEIELHFPDGKLGLILSIHDRGAIIFFPYMAYSVLSQIVVGMCYTYIRFLYDVAGFWSYDPQLNVLSYADDFQSIEQTVRLMDAIMPRLLPG